MGNAVVTQMDFAPIILKNLVLDCDLPQGSIAEALGVSRPTVNSCLNKGYNPTTRPNFRTDMEAFLRQSEKWPQITMWLGRRGLTMRDIWSPSDNEQRWKNPAGTNTRKVAAERKNSRTAATVPGNPEIITLKEVEMLTAETMRHFKLFRPPFINDIQQSADIYKSEDHMFIEAAMVDAARNGGFLAVIGEVGSGKSTIRREVMVQLKRENKILIVFPQIIDKGRISAGSLCDAIIMDLSEEKPKIKQEHKTRQVTRLLQARKSAGYHVALFLEEAHDLTTTALKHLKRIHEIEEGYSKLLSIVLIGQPELKQTLSEEQHPEMREVIRRIQKAEIMGLNGDLKSYLALKFKRIGSSLDKIMTDDAVEALSRKLSTTGERGRKVSYAFPLLVNNLVAQAMNMAVELGEERVTAEVVEAL